MSVERDLSLFVCVEVSCCSSLPFLLSHRKVCTPHVAAGNSLREWSDTSHNNGVRFVHIYLAKTVELERPSGALKDKALAWCVFSVCEFVELSSLVSNPSFRLNIRSNHESKFSATDSDIVLDYDFTAS